MGLKVTISGSFSKQMEYIAKSKMTFELMGSQVLSPLSTDVISYKMGEFLFVEGDPRSPNLAEERHLKAIEHSDMLWLAIHDGYVGSSTAFEIGWAIGKNIPIMSKRLPDDSKTASYVTRVEDEREAVRRLWKRNGKDLPYYLQAEAPHAEINERLAKLEKDLPNKSLYGI